MGCYILIISGEYVPVNCSNDDFDHPATGRLGTLRVAPPGRLVTFGSVEPHTHMPDDAIVAVSCL